MTVERGVPRNARDRRASSHAGIRTVITRVATLQRYRSPRRPTRGGFCSADG